MRPDHPVMTITVVDHTEPRWASVYARRGRENGAATYSREIVKHHIPVWRSVLPRGSLVSTCPLLINRDVRAPLIVQYLHTFIYDDPLRDIRRVSEWLANRCDRLVFVTAYRSLRDLAVAAGFEAVFVPMTLDAEPVRKHRAGKSFRKGCAIYFGNVTKTKESAYERTMTALREAGWNVDVISNGRMGSRQLTQSEAWEVISHYRYGVGVGRCLLEMQALGLRVLVSGVEFGGLMADEADWVAQRSANFGGRVATWNRDPRLCVEGWDAAIIRDPDPPSLAAVTIDEWAASQRF